MFILDTMLVGSLRFVLDKIVAAADAEARDDSSLREQLLEAQMRLELGELSAEEFAGIERDVLARIREIRGDREAVTMTSPGVKVTGVEASVADEVAEPQRPSHQSQATSRKSRAANRESAVGVAAVTHQRKPLARRKPRQPASHAS